MADNKAAIAQIMEQKMTQEVSEAQNAQAEPQAQPNNDPPDTSSADKQATMQQPPPPAATTQNDDIKKQIEHGATLYRQNQQMAERLRTLEAEIERRNFEDRKFQQDPYGELERKGLKITDWARRINNNGKPTPEQEIEELRKKIDEQNQQLQETTRRVFEQNRKYTEVTRMLGCDEYKDVQDLISWLRVANGVDPDISTWINEAENVTRRNLSPREICDSLNTIAKDRMAMINERLSGYRPQEQTTTQPQKNPKKPDPTLSSDKTSNSTNPHNPIKNHAQKRNDLIQALISKKTK